MSRKFAVLAGLAVVTLVAVGSEVPAQFFLRERLANLEAQAAYGARPVVYNPYAQATYNPYVGTSYVQPAYNPYTGMRGATEAGYNPYTGTRGVSETGYNPYTGTHAAQSAAYNPQTG